MERLFSDGALSVRDLDTQYNIALPEDPAYATVGGFRARSLGFFRRVVKVLTSAIFVLTVMEMDGRRVARVKIQLLPQELPGERERPLLRGR